MIESGRRHGAFDVRYPTRQKTAALAWELQREGDRRARLGWSTFLAGSFPNVRRHDFKALAAYEAYGSALDRAASLRRAGRPSWALSVWESEGGSVEHGDRA